MGTGFRMQTDERGNVKGVIEEQPPGNLPSLKPDDYQYFDKLLVDIDETTLSAEEQRERKIMKLLLKIKNGTPPMRKVCGFTLFCYFFEMLLVQLYCQKVLKKQKFSFYLYFSTFSFFFI